MDSSAATSVATVSWVHEDLCRFAGVDPAAEDGDTLGGPRSVAWHGAGPEPVEDGVGLARNVVEGPEVEAEAHRIAVALAKQRLDVLFETGRLVWPRHPSEFSPVAATLPVTKRLAAAPVAEVLRERVHHGGQRALNRSERARLG
jgi:hypothetical protein